MKKTVTPAKRDRTNNKRIIQKNNHNPSKVPSNITEAMRKLVLEWLI